MDKIHNLFINDSWTSVFKAREVLYDLAVKEYKISYENAEHIFAIVEAQLGVDMPVPGWAGDYDQREKGI